jgi:hypothetical protein
MGRSALPGESIPLTLTLETGLATLFPRAQLLDPVGAAVGAPVALTPVAGQDGTYIASITLPSTAGHYTVRYNVYTDAGFTSLSTLDLPTEETIVLADVATDVWRVLRNVTVPSGSYGEAMKALLGISGKANYRIDKMTYAPNRFLQNAKLRVFPDEATATASTSRASGNNDLEGAIIEVDLSGVADILHQTLPSTVLGLLTTP